MPTSNIFPLTPMLAVLTRQNPFSAFFSSLTLMDYLIFVPFILFFILLAIFAMKQNRRQRQDLATLAGQLGFQLVQPRGIPGRIDKPMPTLEGRHRSRDVRFFTIETFIGRKQSVLVMMHAVEANVGDSDFIFELYSNSTGFRLRLEDTLAEVRTDDDAFNQAFTIKSNDVRRAQALLTPKIRDWLLPKGAPGTGDVQVTLRDGQARYGNLHSSLGSIERMTAQMDFVCDLAEAADATSQRS